MKDRWKVKMGIDSVKDDNQQKISNQNSFNQSKIKAQLPADTDIQKFEEIDRKFDILMEFLKSQAEKKEEEKNTQTQQVIVPAEIQIPQENNISIQGTHPADNIQIIEKPKKTLSEKISFWIVYCFSFVALAMLIFYYFNQIKKVELFTSAIIGVIASAVIIVLIAWIIKLFNKFIKKKKKRVYYNSDISISGLEINNVKRCPICDSKLIKGKTKTERDFFKQNIKCSDADCDFRKELAFRVE